MDDNAIHEWLIKCFGPIQGEHGLAADQPVAEDDP